MGARLVLGAVHQHQVRGQEAQAKHDVHIPAITNDVMRENDKSLAMLCVFDKFDIYPVSGRVASGHTGAHCTALP